MLYFVNPEFLHFSHFFCILYSAIQSPAGKKDEQNYFTQPHSSFPKNTKNQLRKNVNTNKSVSLIQDNLPSIVFKNNTTPLVFSQPFFSNILFIKFVLDV